jgi:hypothetical protein
MHGTMIVELLQNKKRRQYEKDYVSHFKCVPERFSTTDGTG